MKHTDYQNWVANRVKTNLETKPKQTLQSLYSQGLIEEVGEISGKLKRLYRNDTPVPTITQLLTELGDVLWYYTALCAVLDIQTPELEETQITTFDLDETSKQVTKLALLTAQFVLDMNNEKKDHALTGLQIGVVASTLGHTMNETREVNHTKLKDRYARGATKGTGDTR